jgi:hypothetical protein
MKKMKMHVSGKIASVLADSVGLNRPNLRSLGFLMKRCRLAPGALHFQMLT